jgi:2-dehydropantoate 2-reductase
MSEQKASRVAVVGAGAIGGFFAAQARLAGHDVVVCTRTPTKEILLESEGETHRLAVSAASSPAEVEPVEWVLLCTKAQDSNAAAPWLARLVGKGTTVAVLQNGLDHEKRIGPLAPQAAILPVLVYTNVERVKPGYLRHHFGNKALVPAGNEGAALAKLFAGSRVRIDQDANFNTALWVKVLSNIAANTLTALTLQRNVVLKRPDLLELSRQIMIETVRVAQAEGAAIKETDIEPFLRAYSGQEDNSPAMTSMVQDRLADRRTEYDFINGEVVRRAARLSIDVPINRAMYALLAAVDAGAGKGAA